MAGLIDTAKDFLKARKFRHSTLGQGLDHLTHQYFYSGQVLSWMSTDAKVSIVKDFYDRLAAIGQEANPAMALRKSLAEYTIVFAQTSVLALTAEEKATMPYAQNPYISAELHHHISKASHYCEEMKVVIDKTPKITAEELVSYANSRSALMLFYANGLNMARIEFGDWEKANDWYRPFSEAMMVWEEDCYRMSLNMPRLLPPPIHALGYSTFMNMVTNGERNPYAAWRTAYPDDYLAGEGRLP